MKILKWLFPRKQPVVLVARRKPEVVVTIAAVEAITACLQPAIRREHEGVAYLLGVTNGDLTLVADVFAPEAVTTRGSFHVTPTAMAKVMRAAADKKLQVVGQIHTHPGEAYHSDGDVEGARIAYSGYVSIVVPDYGRQLPGFREIAVYMYRAPSGFAVVASENFTLLGAS